jgi:hypothetical protein
MENAIWSSMLARRVAQALGYGVPDVTTEPEAVPYGPEAEAVVGELTETFRYLPLEKVRQALDFAEFLRTEKIVREPPAHRPTWAAEKLSEVRDLALFLRERYGAEQPADEKDYWTEEDQRDFTQASQRRLEEEDPWPEGDYPAGEQGNA